MAGNGPARVSPEVGIQPDWAMLKQVHSAMVVEATSPGRMGQGDALVTQTVGLPIAVLMADCGGIVLEAGNTVGVVHAGWRGVVAGVVAEAARYIEENMADRVLRAALGPLIGPCCFEVGEEVAARFPGWESTTRWGTRSVDLAAAIRAQAPDAVWWSADACTRCGEGWFSHRRNGTVSRMAAIGWMS